MYLTPCLLGHLVCVILEPPEIIFNDLRPHEPCEQLVSRFVTYLQRPRMSQAWTVLSQSVSSKQHYGTKLEDYQGMNEILNRSRTYSIFLRDVFHFPHPRLVVSSSSINERNHVM